MDRGSHGLVELMGLMWWQMWQIKVVPSGVLVGGGLIWVWYVLLGRYEDGRWKMEGEGEGEEDKLGWLPLQMHTLAPHARGIMEQDACLDCSKMSDPYEKAKGGRLTFKGGSLATRSKSIDKKKQKKKKKNKDKDPTNDEPILDMEAGIEDAVVAVGDESGQTGGVEYTIDAAKRMKYEQLFPVEAKKFSYDPKAKTKSIEDALDDRVKKKADRYWMRHNGMALAEKSILEILVAEVANNVLCSVVDSKTNTFLDSLLLSVHISVLRVNYFCLDSTELTAAVGLIGLRALSPFDYNYILLLICPV
ncbi:hypothetical protein CMV_018799 [Castanea mollissima]|uniref:Uncharacterized protein n=2 Tax=Castanea mollissima TaxID=60419 RepID=A0A8J4R2T0_9ROSI|nr:hypothetical protein CMV_018799 [Castanea mollissima]